MSACSVAECRLPTPLASPPFVPPSSRGQTNGRRSAATQGDGLKKVPAGFPADHRFADDLKRKEFFRLVPFTKKQVLAADFPRTIEGAMRELEPMLGFFAKALKLPWRAT